MIQIPDAKRKDDPKANEDGYMPCIVCGRAVDMDRPHWMVYVHDGGTTIVTEAEREAKNTINSSGDLCAYPIGPDCLKRNPDVKPYAIRVKPYQPDGVTSVPGFGSISL